MWSIENGENTFGGGKDLKVGCCVVWVWRRRDVVRRRRLSVTSSSWRRVWSEESFWCRENSCDQKTLKSDAKNIRKTKKLSKSTLNFAKKRDAEEKKMKKWKVFLNSFSRKKRDCCKKIKSSNILQIFWQFRTWRILSSFFPKVFFPRFLSLRRPHN